MPKGYWIVRVDIREPERYHEYLAAAQPAPQASPGQGAPLDPIANDPKWT